MRAVSAAGLAVVLVIGTIGAVLTVLSVAAISRRLENSPGMGVGLSLVVLVLGYSSTLFACIATLDKWRLW